MSTTFQIYPRSSRIPTFSEVVDLTSREMSRRLEELQIYQTIQMTYPLRSLDERSFTMPDPSQDFVWEKDSYLWFGISGLEGGIDGYCLGSRESFGTSFLSCRSSPGARNWRWSVWQRVTLGHFDVPWDNWESQTFCTAFLLALLQSLQTA